MPEKCDTLWGAAFVARAIRRMIAPRGRAKPAGMSRRAVRRAVREAVRRAQADA